MTDERPDESGSAPEPPVVPPPPLAPDPASFDHPRGVQARARGLAAPYIAGGRDPEPERGRAEERRYLRILIAMVVVIVLSGFVLGILANVLRLLGAG